MTVIHKPVLKDEALEALAIQPHKTYLDVTFGGGGHTCAILDSDPTIKVIALDWDKAAVKRAEPLIEKYGDRFQFVWGSFAHLYKLVKKHKFPKFAGILADFGTSYFQIYEQSGFSFTKDTPLDMRMSTGHFRITAYSIVNFAHELELCEIFWKYGEEQNAKRIVRKILEVRKKKRIKTTHELADLIASVVPRRGKRTHPATKVFQALRIFVNKELENIQAFLPASLDALEDGGKLVCISFHSLEDREVKWFLKERESLGQVVLPKPECVKPSKEEIEENPSSRSAKLRAAQKVVSA